MIGVLCNRKHKSEITKLINSAFHANEYFSENPIIIFSVDDIDLIEGVVNGAIINRDGIVNGQKEIPSIILNLSIQAKRDNIKKIRGLQEINNTKIINGVNKYNQLMMMKIISSNSTLKEYLIPYKEYTAKNLEHVMVQGKDIIVMPYKSTAFTKIIYMKKSNASYKMVGNYSSLDNESGKEDSITNIPEKKNCVILNPPELLMDEGVIISARVYVQRANGGKWKILKINIPDIDNNYKNYNLFRNIGDDAIDLINYISKFMPDLGNNFIDFVFDIKGNPYFFHLGGRYKHYLAIMKDEDYLNKFYNNLIGFSKYCAKE